MKSKPEYELKISKKWLQNKFVQSEQSQVKNDYSDFTSFQKNFYGSQQHIWSILEVALNQGNAAHIESWSYDA